MNERDAICMDAILVKVETMPDGGWRVRFDVPESSGAQVLQLATLREMALRVVVMPTECVNG